jgi:hypothetical protein
MPNKQLAEYVCDTAYYRAMWKVSVWPWVLAPVFIVALAILGIAVVF